MNIVFAIVLSVVIHEAGHLVAARSLGVKVKRVGVSWLGPYVVRDPGSDLQNIAISLAGPIANLATVPAVFLAIHLTHHIFGAQLCFMSISMGLFNLLPLPKSDGRRVLQIMKVRRGRPDSPNGGALGPGYAEPQSRQRRRDSNLDVRCGEKTASMGSGQVCNRLRASGARISPAAEFGLGRWDQGRGFPPFFPPLHVFAAKQTWFTDIPARSVTVLGVHENAASMRMPCHYRTRGSTELCPRL